MPYEPDFMSPSEATLRLLYAISIADGSIDDSEARFIDIVANQTGLAKDLQEKVRSEVESVPGDQLVDWVMPAIGIFVDQTIELKAIMLAHAAGLADADGRLHPNEKALIARIQRIWQMNT